MEDPSPTTIPILVRHMPENRATENNQKSDFGHEIYHLFKSLRKETNSRITRTPGINP